MKMQTTGSSITWTPDMKTMLNGTETRGKDVQKGSTGLAINQTFVRRRFDLARWGLEYRFGSFDA